jgi:hypothetical protein
MPKRSSRSSSSSRGSSSVDSCSGQFHERGETYDCWKCAGCGEWYCFHRSAGSSVYAGPPRALDRRFGWGNCYGRAGRKDARGQSKLSGCGPSLFLSPAAPNPPQPAQPGFPDWDEKKAAPRRKKKEDNIDG